MSDYAFVHEGKAYTPNRTAVPLEDVAAHNAKIEEEELAYWQAQPNAMFCYFGKGLITTWTGHMIGTITSSRVYRHNLGGQFITMTVRGTNGANYYGRASYSWGQCINLHKAKR